MINNKLSFGAQEVLKSVLAAMQDAEEMQGTNSTEDYVSLMDAIIAEAMTRKNNAMEAT